MRSLSISRKFTFIPIQLNYEIKTYIIMVVISPAQTVDQLECDTKIVSMSTVCFYAMGPQTAEQMWNRELDSQTDIQVEGHIQRI